jgi:hypothetical protein
MDGIIEGFAKGSIPATDPYCWTDPSLIKINDATIENMLSWHHSGFHVYRRDPERKSFFEMACTMDAAGEDGFAPIKIDPAYKSFGLIS